MPEQTICIVCQQPIENLEEAHHQHQYGCPALVYHDNTLCTCDAHYTHPQCCPDCNASPAAHALKNFVLFLKDLGFDVTVEPEEDIEQARKDNFRLN